MTALALERLLRQENKLWNRTIVQVCAGVVAWAHLAESAQPRHIAGYYTGSSMIMLADTPVFYEPAVPDHEIWGVRPTGDPFTIYSGKAIA